MGDPLGPNGTRHSYNSSSSAIDLSGTGLGGVQDPLSPSLRPSDVDSGGHTRRRLSWTNAEGRPDIPRLNLPEPGPSSLSLSQRFTSSNRHEREGTFSTACLEASSATLVPSPYADATPMDDDATRLLGGAWGKGDGRRSRDLFVDTEWAEAAGSASRPRRESTAPSPLRRRLTDAFRRASMRVASATGHGPYARVHEEDEDASDSGSTLDGNEEIIGPGVDEGDTSSSVHLRGRALGILGPTNPLRVQLYNIFINPYTDPMILVLIILNAVALVVQASRTQLLPPNQTLITIVGYFHTWEDYVIFVLFIIFTIEALGRICVSGLLLDPDVPVSSLCSLSFSKLARSMSTNTVPRGHIHTSPARHSSLARGHTLKRVYDNLSKPFLISLSSHARPSGSDPSYALYAKRHLDEPDLPPTFLSRAMKSDILEADPGAIISLPFRLDLQIARSRLERNIPYLRQGWGRIDFIAIIGFWVSFALAMTGLERSSHHIGIYRALSVLRTARLLSITNGTATIMRSLKIARPLLEKVVYFIIFAMVLFSIVGVQSFKGSLRRSCNLLPTIGENGTRLTQVCGGHINASTLAPSPYLLPDGTSAGITKGFICPLGQVCQEGQNPYSGIESFDTVYYATLQVVILASANTWSQVMYQIMASEYLVASIFFILGILVLNFWLFNLLVAVITNSFSAIRSGTKKSAFGAAPLGRVVEEPEEGWSATAGPRVGRNRLKAWWSYTSWFWVFLSLASLVVQATLTADTTPMHREIIDITECIITFAFDIEIIVRFAVELPAWRNFCLHANNWSDLIIAIGSSVIQIPVIHTSSVYPWLTIIPLARFYRVLLVVPRMKPLMLTVFGNMYGLANMSLFLILMNVLAALFAIQLLQGDMVGTVTMNFGQLYNAFLAMYQICSSENWTTVLYDATDAELSLNQAVTVCMFLCCWLLFSNFIVMQMFIAVINENFSVAEEAKRKLQASSYSEQNSRSTLGRWISLLNPYLWFKPRSRMLTIDSENPTSGTILGEADTFVQNSPLPMDYPYVQRRVPTSTSNKSHLRQASFSLLHDFFTGDEKTEDIPLMELHRAPSEPRENPFKHETDQYFDILAGMQRQKEPSSGYDDTHRRQTIELIQRHPSYDRSFWMFSQTNRLRRLCQKIVYPSGGERIFGTPPSDVAHTFFQLAIFLVVSGSIATEAFATPVYRLHYYTQHGLVRGAWFNITEAIFGFILVLEFLIKITADGFLFTPNAYIRSIWNVLDFVIMVGVIVNVSFTLVFIGGLSRFIRGLKALQALRFVTLIKRMRKTFEDLILAGFVRILDAALLAVLYLIPFSVWGTTIFAGLMNECNDTSVTGIAGCTTEYVNTIYGNSYGFLVPRAWDHPAPSTTFSFDSFRASLLILFEIVSLEGWIDVMSVAMSITGPGLQPQTNASQVNAIFFVIYHLLGAAIILTLFVSIIIGNFSSRTGSAYVTEAQREWIDLQKLLKRLKPSKRPKVKPTFVVRAWCYDRAIHKHGWWTRMMTIFFVAQIIVLMTESFSPEAVNDWHNITTLIISSMYVLDTSVRLFGLGWNSFRANGWNIFDIIVASGSFATTLAARYYPDNFALQLLQKLFLVSIAFKLVQRIPSLNQLFKTGTASLPVILNLLAFWFTLFLFFAIMFMEVFGMNKWFSGETRYQNFQSMGMSLLMLVFMSTGEGWNQFMHDYTLDYPRCTQVTHGLYQTDCGSTAWAYSMFIAWNLLSMYIFVNMFTGVIVESFSYVFQSTGGVVKSITRHETRAFKKAWAQFADPNTGLLERPNLVPFLAKLSGVFEVRIYPSQHSVKSILATCWDKSKKDNKTGGFHVRKLNKLLNTLDVGVIRKRRAIYMRIYHEANLLCIRGKGISFTDMLILLAHYTLINDYEALGLKELEVREETLKVVAGLVGLDKIQSQLSMISLRRAFLQKRNKKSARTTMMTRTKLRWSGLEDNLERVDFGD